MPLCWFEGTLPIKHSVLAQLLRLCWFEGTPPTRQSVLSSRTCFRAHGHAVAVANVFYLSFRQCMEYETICTHSIVLFLVLSVYCKFVGCYRNLSLFSWFLKWLCSATISVYLPSTRENGVQCTPFLEECDATTWRGKVRGVVRVVLCARSGVAKRSTSLRFRTPFPFRKGALLS